MVGSIKISPEQQEINAQYRKDKEAKKVKLSLREVAHEIALKRAARERELLERLISEL